MDYTLSTAGLVTLLIGFAVYLVKRMIEKADESGAKERKTQPRRILLKSCLLQGQKAAPSHHDDEAQRNRLGRSSHGAQYALAPKIAAARISCQLVSGRAV